MSYSTDGDVFKADKPRQWSERRLMLRARYRPFDIHPDGELVFNFFDELRRVAPAE